MSKKYVLSERNSVVDEENFCDNEALRSQVRGDVGLLLLLLRLLYTEEEAVVEEDREGDANIRRKQWVFFIAVLAAAISNGLIVLLRFISTNFSFLELGKRTRIKFS